MSFVKFIKFCVCPSLPFRIEGGMWDVIVSIPDHCFFIHFAMQKCPTIFSTKIFHILTFEILTKC